MINKIKNRLASEQGFTLIELLVVIIILGILVAIAVPAYLSFTGKAHRLRRQVERPLGDPGGRGLLPGRTTTQHGTYNGLDGANLTHQAPGVDPNVLAVAVSTGGPATASRTPTRLARTPTTTNGGPRPRQRPATITTDGRPARPRTGRSR